MDARRYITLSSSGVIPQIPTREQVCGVNMTFQGLTVQTNDYGSLPWFDPALFSLSTYDRESVYNAKHSTGRDSHAWIAFDDNEGSIYDEPGQPYQQMNGAGFAHKQNAFIGAITEVIGNGFIPIISMSGDAFGFDY